MTVTHPHSAPWLHALFQDLTPTARVVRGSLIGEIAVPDGSGMAVYRYTPQAAINRYLEAHRKPDGTLDAEGRAGVEAIMQELIALIEQLRGCRCREGGGKRLVWRA